jgi:hypothetical protein
MARDVRFGSLADLIPRMPGCPLYPLERTCSASAPMSAKCQKRTLLPLDVWQLVGSIEDRLRSTNQKHHSLMACCASSRPLLDGFFSRSAASFASRSLRKRSVFWARSSRSSSCSSFNERFVGALGFFSIVASCVNVFGRCARFIGALGFFSVASCSRFVG